MKFILPQNLGRSHENTIRSFNGFSWKFYMRPIGKRIIKKCVVCEKDMSLCPSEIKKGKKFCSLKCCWVDKKVSLHSASFKKGVHKSVKTEFKKGYNLGNKHPRWVGGRIKNERGYFKIKSPNHPLKDSSGYVYEHRIVVERHLGRNLTPTEVVHHINHNKSDNRIENLMVFKDNYSHRRWHAIEIGVKSDDVIFNGCSNKSIKSMEGEKCVQCSDC